jgi:hypothetical protein
MYLIEARVILVKFWYAKFHHFHKLEPLIKLARAVLLAVLSH